jgi:hypothetical protein
LIEILEGGGLVVCEDVPLGLREEFCRANVRSAGRDRRRLKAKARGLPDGISDAAPEPPAVAHDILDDMPYGKKLGGHCIP